MKTIYDAIIIGAGASGLACAISAARSGKHVLVLEKNKKPGKKLYATGNGKCNLTNKLIDTRICYVSGNPDYERFLGAFFAGGDLCAAVCTFFNSIGIQTVALGDYVYPASEQASSVVWAMLDELKRFDVNIETSGEVTEIKKQDDLFFLKTASDTYSCKKVVLATGGKSYPSLGGSESGYELCKGLGVEMTDTYPALCGFTINKPAHFELLKGLRVKGIVSSVHTSGLTVRREKGEVQFTEDGLSGIVCMNATCVLPARLSLNLISAFSDDIADTFLAGAKEENGLYAGRFKDRTLIGFLNGYLPDKLCEYLVLTAGYERQTTCGELNSESLLSLIRSAADITFEINGLFGYEKAQVTAGGIDLSEVDPNTMELVNHRGIHATGELLDITGICGGYNLTFAFLSGIRAGVSL